MSTRQRVGVVAVVAGIVSCLASRPLVAAPEPSPGATTPQIHLVLDEADAALAILAARGDGSGEVGAAAWERLWASEGFRRLQKRQESFGATGVRESMREYLLSPEALAAAPGLRAAVGSWRTLDVGAAAARAAVYLPPGVPLRATLYPVIKRSTNSFVFELATDPAMFLSVDPAAAPERVANHLAHELHHVGTAACQRADDSALPAPRRAARQWLGGFGEGIAVLAAAGGPDVHPHATSPAEEWLVWQRDLLRAPADWPRLEEFFGGVLAGSWTPEEQQRRFLALIATDEVPQGPFYTVGWLMASAVERRFGRGAVAAAACEPLLLLERYEQAIGELPAGATAPPRWSPGLLAALRGAG